MQEILDYLKVTGFANLQWGNIVLFLLAFALIYISVAKKLEPYVLLPIGLGIILGNLPLANLTNFDTSGSVQGSGILGVIFHYTLSSWNILPPLIFLGLGAMTDFGPIIANPKTLILGAAAQIGILGAFWGALATGQFTINEAAAIGIIGGADGPTTIFVSSRLSPDLLGTTAVVAYSYMAGVVFIQPPLMRLLTTKKERAIVMRQPREVSRLEKLVFPAIALVGIILLVPESAPLISMFMIGNLFKEAGVVSRLRDAASNDILNIATIFLMLTVGAQLSANKVLVLDTLLILVLGLGAFALGTAGGLLGARLMNLFLKEKLNPLIGSAGVSAVPMAARLVHLMGQKANPQNFLLPHAMGPNVAGVIGSAIIAGVFIALVE